MEAVYIITPLLLLAVVLAAVWLDRFSVPVILVALGLGLLAGRDVLGLWHLDDLDLAHEVADAGLVFILLQGRLVPKRSVPRPLAPPGAGPAAMSSACGTSTTSPLPTRSRTQAWCSSSSSVGASPNAASSEL